MIMHSLQGSSVKIGTIQRRLAWPLRKDDTHKSRSVNIIMIMIIITMIIMIIITMITLLLMMIVIVIVTRILVTIIVVLMKTNQLRETHNMTHNNMQYT